MNFGTQYFETIFQGLDMYNKMTKAWLEFIELSSKGKQEDVMKAWTESFTSYYKDMFGMFSRSFRMLGFPVPAEKASWEEVLNPWQQFLPTAMRGFTPPFRGIDEFIKFSRGWQEDYAKVYEVWLDCLQKVAETYKSGIEKREDAGKMLMTCVESSEGFIEAWTSFLTKQTVAYFRLLKTSLAGEKEVAGEKVEVRKKKETA